MNRIFKLYRIKNINVTDTMSGKDMDADVFVEENKYFIKSLAVERVRDWLSIEKYTDDSFRYTIVEALENTENLEALIIKNLSECMKLIGYGSFAKTFVYSSQLEKYLAARTTTDSIFSVPPKIKVLVEPASANLVSNNSKAPSRHYNADVIKRRLELLLDDQFEIEVNSVIFSDDLDVFLTKVPVAE